MSKTKLLSAQDVAEYFLWRSGKEGKAITNKKLQKLVYYSQAWSLVIRDEKLFGDKIEAWVHGPAVRAVYVKYKKFGFGPITQVPTEKNIETISDTVRSFLDQVWKIYGKYDAAYLEHLSHSESPWQKARENLAPNIGSENEISLDDMKLFYGSKLQPNN